MAAVNILSDIRFWIVTGVACAAIIGPVGDLSSAIVIIVLIAQMTLSMDGLSLSSDSIKKNKNQIALSAAACFIISTAVTLLIGSFFISGHPNLWNGWIMLAAVPCAVSCVTMSFFLKGNTMMCVLALAVIYFAALAVTPLTSRALMGESVSVLRIFSYVILFVIIPMAASVPMKKLRINRTARVIAINVMMFVMVFLSLGQNRGYIFSEPGVVMLVAAACVIRIFGVSMVMLYLMKRRGVRRDNGIVYLSMAVWKNSGLAATLCFVLFGSAAEAVLPCAISLLIEIVWFAAISGYIEKTWPAVKEPGPADG